MRAVVRTGPGKVELNFMWLPTFIGMSGLMKAELEKKLVPEFTGKPLTEETLDEAHDRAVELILEKFPLPGLRDYLDAMKFVEG
jgi:hypothetical protein